MLSIKLPQSIERLLEKLARRTGRTKSFYVREAIVRHIEDLEDIYLTERALKRLNEGQDKAISLDEIIKHHQLAD